jgi:hypothetical protein
MQVNTNVLFTRLGGVIASGQVKTEVKAEAVESKADVIALLSEPASSLDEECSHVIIDALSGANEDASSDNDSDDKSNRKNRKKHKKSWGTPDAPSNSE